MAYKISDATKLKLDNCCESCRKATIGTHIQNLGTDLDAGTNTVCSVFSASELAAVNAMCEANKIIAEKYNLAVLRLKTVTLPDVDLFTADELKKIDGSCNAFIGIGTAMNGMITAVNAIVA